MLICNLTPVRLTNFGLTKPERIESLLEIGTSVKKVRFICSSWSEISSNTDLETQAQNVRQNELKST